MTADSTSNNHSPLRSGGGGGGDGINSPQFRRRNLSSPWAQVVRGEPEAISALPRSPSSPSSSSSPPITTPNQSTFSDCSASKAASMASDISAVESQLENFDSNNNNVGRPTRTAWNKPLNGVVEVGPVMGGAVSWPALSESTRPSPKPSSDSSKPISDGSVSISQGPVISHSPQKQVNTNANPNFTPNHTLPVRQRSMKRGGGGSAQSNFTRPPPPPPLPPPFPLFEVPYGTLVPAVPDLSPREPLYRSNNWETRPIGGFVPKSHAGNDHPSQRNSSRRSNFGPRPRGDGSYHNNYGSRRNQDRDWSAARSSNVRDVNVQHQIHPPRSFGRPPPPGSSPFTIPQPVRSFGNSMSFDMTSPFLYVSTLPPESFRSVPFVGPAPPPTMFFPVLDPSLPTLLVHQIEYYFSDANLIKDDFLKSNMDDEGWVPITLIASFPRVQHLTYNIQLILHSLRASTAVEVQGDKVRRRNEWRKWIPASGQFPTDDSGSHSPNGSGYSMLATSFQKVTLDEATINHNSAMGKADPHIEAAPGRCSSEELTGQSKLANGEGTNEEACSSKI
uniref:Putative la-related protein 1C-like n=1 Tax=Davidia involucrata TaxID=16924 RepID=A0A5B6YWY6_DAVIN